MYKKNSRTNKIFDEWVKENTYRITDSLIELIRIDTATPHEYRAYEFLIQYLERSGISTELQYLNKQIVNHEEASRHSLSIKDETRANIRGYFSNSNKKGLEKVLFSAHIDVVPAGGEFPNAFNPVFKEGKIFGRGACDTKNNIILLAEALRFCYEQKIVLSKDVIIDFVIEEELGGAGALSSATNGIQADAAVILEPTSLNVYRGHRGCLGIEVMLKGDSEHMSSGSNRNNVIKLAYVVISELERLEYAMNLEAKSKKEYDLHVDPIKLHVSKINGGQWHGSAPEFCTMSINLGFIYPDTFDTIERKIFEVLSSRKEFQDGVSFEIRRNGICNSPYLLDDSSPIVEKLMQTASVLGINQKGCFAWNASCDGRLYNNICGIPTVIFGSGNLALAHSSKEYIDLNELILGMKILVNFLISE